MPSSSSRRHRRRSKPVQPGGLRDPIPGAEAELPRPEASAVHHRLDRVPRPALPNPNPPEPQPHSDLPSTSRHRRRRRRGGRGRNKPPPTVSQPELEKAGGMRCGAELPLYEPSAVPHVLDRVPCPALPNPNPPDPQPHHATPSSSSRRRRGRRGRKGPPSAAVEARDWADLPLDMLSAILHKVDQVEILMGAGQVCRSWRRATRDVPGLWRRIDIRGHGDYQYDLYKIACVAISRSEGQCEAFWSEWAGDEDLLLFLGDRAPSLKSLRLISCHGLDNEGLANAIYKFSLLEELELSLCSNISGKHVFEVVAIACPQLRRFRLSNMRFYNYEDRENYFINFVESYNEYKFNKDDDAKGIATMHKLRSLQLFANRLTNEGLTVILDNCPHLESLDIRHCFNVTMDDALRAKCSKIETLRLPYDSTYDYEFEVMRPLWSRSEVLGIQSDSDDSVYGGPEYIMDSDEYEDYRNSERYLDDVYIGRRVTVVSTFAGSVARPVNYEA